MDKYSEIFEQKYEEVKGDRIDAFKQAMHAMRIAMIKDFPVWMKFNAVSWMIPYDLPDSDIKWEEVNELLKSESEYDFNAFDYIDSKEKFTEALFNCNVSTITGLNAPYVRRTCKDCGETFTLTLGQVMFFCKHEYPLQKRCPNCLSIKKTGKPLDGYEFKKVDGKKVVVRKEEKGYTPGFSQPLNGFAEALQKAGFDAKAE